MAIQLKNYIFNFTDPLNGQILVQPFTGNGTVFPTVSTPLDARSVAADTSLLFLGRGSGDYGERLEENILHLLENFSGASIPQNAISGQLWFSRRDYWSDGTDFYFWDTNLLSWTVITNIVVSATTPVGSSDGDYWTDSLSAPTFLKQLTLLNDPSRPTSAALSLWIDKDFVQSITTPTAPEKILKVFDGTNFIPANLPMVSSETPVDPVVGMLWFDTNTNQLKIYNGAIFESTSFPLEHGVASTSFNMNGNGILGLPAVPAATGAASKEYVDTLVTGGIGAIDTDLVGNASTVPGVTATDALDALLLKDGSIPMSGALDMGTNFIINVVNPINPQDAATKDYVDSVSGGGADGVVTAGSVASTGVLTLTRSIGAPLSIIDFNLVDITITPAGGIASTTVQTAIFELDTKKAPLDSPQFTTQASLDVGAPLLLGNITPIKASEATSKQYVDSRNYPIVQNLDTAGGSTFSTVPPYTVGFNHLWVFQNGLKLLATVTGFQNLDVGGVITDLSVPTGLSLATSYDFRINVDGGGDVVINVNGTNAQTYNDLITDLNANVTFNIIAFASVANGNLRFTSLGSVGTGSSVLLSPGLSNDMFVALTPIPGTPEVPATPGVTYDYEEVGLIGSTSTTINTTAVIPGGTNLEFLVV